MMPGSPMNMYATPSIRAMPPIAVVWPCQNSCQVAGETVAGSQVLTYGPRTTSGAAGGRVGGAGRRQHAGPGDGSGEAAHRGDATGKSEEIPSSGPVPGRIRPDQGRGNWG